MKKIFNTIYGVCFLSLILLSTQFLQAKNNITRAAVTLDSLYAYFSVDNSFLLRETYPFNQTHQVTYLSDNEQAKARNPYSYLWPYSGSLSAVSAIYEANLDNQYKKLFDKRVVPGIQLYWDTKRKPGAYASYVKITPLPDRFYDDNVWIGIDFTDMYLQTKEKKYLKKAKEVWKFIESGTDEVLEGGIYWVEQRKRSKHACSNAPGAVYAVKLYGATQDEKYLNQAKELYDWTKKYLQDPEDYLIYDNINRNGRVDKKKYAYNSGQMIQAAALLYKQTNDATYLQEAQQIAASAYDYFFHQNTEDDLGFRLLKSGDIWFTAVMFRGYIELYSIDENKTYINAFLANLDHAWHHMRDSNGLFNTDWKGSRKDKSKWLLTQFAMVEMYARSNNL